MQRSSMSISIRSIALVVREYLLRQRRRPAA